MQRTKEDTVLTDHFIVIYITAGNQVSRKVRARYFGLLKKVWAPDKRPLPIGRTIFGGILILSKTLSIVPTKLDYKMLNIKVG